MSVLLPVLLGSPLCIASEPANAWNGPTELAFLVSVSVARLLAVDVSCALGAAHRMHGDAIGWQARRDATRREFDSIWPGVRRAVRAVRW